MTRELLKRCLEWIDRHHWTRDSDRSVCLDCGEATAVQCRPHAKDCPTTALIAELDAEIARAAQPWPRAKPHIFIEEPSMASPDLSAERVTGIRNRSLRLGHTTTGDVLDLCDALTAARAENARLRAELDRTQRLIWTLWDRWAFNEDQAPTHSWHDKEDCRAMVEDALSKASPQHRLKPMPLTNEDLAFVNQELRTENAQLVEELAVARSERDEARAARDEYKARWERSYST